MRQQQMTRLIHSLPQLTHRQRQQLASCLYALMDRSQATAVVETFTSGPRACPHCTSTLLVKNGSANGLQRFKCRQCAHTFNALTGTPLARLHLRAKWMGQAQALGEGLSLNQVAHRLGVAQSTVFRWLAARVLSTHPYWWRETVREQRSTSSWRRTRPSVCKQHSSPCCHRTPSYAPMAASLWPVQRGSWVCSTRQ